MKTIAVLLLITCSAYGQKKVTREIYKGREIFLSVTSAHREEIDKSYTIRLIGVNYARNYAPMNETNSLSKRNRTGFISEYKGSKYQSTDYNAIFDGEPKSFYSFIIQLQGLLNSNDLNREKDIDNRHVSVISDSKSEIIEVKWLNNVSFYNCGKEEIDAIIKSFEKWATENDVLYK